MTALNGRIKELSATEKNYGMQLQSITDQFLCLPSAKDIANINIVM